MCGAASAVPGAAAISRGHLQNTEAMASGRSLTRRPGALSVENGNSQKVVVWTTYEVEKDNLCGLAIVERLCHGPLMRWKDSLCGPIRRETVTAGLKSMHWQAKQVLTQELEVIKLGESESSRVESFLSIPCNLGVEREAWTLLQGQDPCSSSPWPLFPKRYFK